MRFTAAKYRNRLVTLATKYLHKMLKLLMFVLLWTVCNVLSSDVLFDLSGKRIVSCVLPGADTPKCASKRFCRSWCLVVTAPPNGPKYPYYAFCGVAGLVFQVSQNWHNQNSFFWVQEKKFAHSVL